MISISSDPDLPPFLSNPDSPIEDIDLPVNGPGVLRPGVSRLVLLMVFMVLMMMMMERVMKMVKMINLDAPIEDVNLPVNGPGVLHPGVSMLRMDVYAGAL